MQIEIHSGYQPPSHGAGARGLNPVCVNYVLQVIANWMNLLRDDQLVLIAKVSFVPVNQSKLAEDFCFKVEYLNQVVISIPVQVRSWLKSPYEVLRIEVPHCTLTAAWLCGAVSAEYEVEFNKKS
jgi:hypothetical protein